MFEKWLKCNVFKGMFSDELAVQYRSVSFFVPKDQVNIQENQNGKVKVLVFRDGETSWAILPSENRSIILVDEADLVVA